MTGGGKANTSSHEQINHNTLEPGHSKGPNHPYLAIDNLVKQVKPMEFRNIPVPLCEALAHMMDAFKAIKHSLHENYNDTMATQRVVNLNGRAIFR